MLKMTCRDHDDSSRQPRWMICFVWFDSLRHINNLSVKQGQVFLGWTSTKLACSRTTTRYAGEAPTLVSRSRVKHSTTEPLHSPRWMSHQSSSYWSSTVCLNRKINCMLFILTFFSYLQILLKIIDFVKTKSVQFAIKSGFLLDFQTLQAV